jgi:hypothetical protein
MEGSFVRVVAIWIFGILACGIAGGLIGAQLDYRDGGPWGFLAGAFAFSCLRLWLSEKASKNSK